MDEWHCSILRSQRGPPPLLSLPQNSQSRRWAPLWGSGEAATSRNSRGWKGGEGRGARRPPRPRLPTGPTKTHRLGDRSQVQHPRSEGKLQHDGSEIRTPNLLIWMESDALTLRHTPPPEGAREGDKRQSQPATARQSSALRQKTIRLIRIRYSLAG